jgi:hypothetical protein
MMDAKVTAVNEKTNGSQEAIETAFPYTATVIIAGSADLLFHRWNSEEVEGKAKAAKNSKAKKTDNLEAYVWRNEDDFLCLPGEYLRQSVINAAKFRQDPRSPRKSAMDLYTAAVVSLTNLASLGVKDWDYEDKRRVRIQRQGVNRVRPAMKAGWQVSIDLLINLPEYVDPISLREVIEQAGRLIGVGDYRPTFGRFGIVGFSVRTEA